MREGDQIQRPKTALQSGSRSRSIRPLRRKTCWALPVSATPHQTGEGLKLCSEFGRFLIPPHKRPAAVSRLTQTSPNDTGARTDTHQSGACEAKDGETPWYLALLSEKEQSLLMLGKEITRLSKFEGDCARKDSEISALREKLQEETRQLRRTNEDVVRAQAELILDLTEEVRRLHRTDKELQQKNTHIAELQQEVTCLRKEPQLQGNQHVSGIIQEDIHQNDLNQPEVTCLREEPSKWEEPFAEASSPLMEMAHESLLGFQSEVLCGKRDECSKNKDNDELANAENKLIAALEKANQTLTHELEEARTNHKMSCGALCSVHRTLSVKEHELLTVKAELKDLKKELKDRKTQIQAMSRKFSCLRDGRKRDELMMTQEKESYCLRQLVAKLQDRLRQRDQSVSEMSKQVCELEKEVREERLLRSRLRREAQEHEEVVKELQLQINSTQVSLEQLQSKYERLRVKVIQAVYSAPGAKPPQKEITDAAIYYTMQKIIDDRSKFYQRLVQRGDKVPSLAINEAPRFRSAPASSRRGSNVLGL